MVVENEIGEERGKLSMHVLIDRSLTLLSTVQLVTISSPPLSNIDRFNNPGYLVHEGDGPSDVVDD